MMPPRSPRFFGAHLLYVSRYLAAPKNVLPELMPFHGDLLKCVLFLIHVYVTQKALNLW